MNVSNGGEAEATDVTASIALPEGLVFASPAGGAGSFAVVHEARLGAFLTFALEGTFTAGDWVCELDDAGSTATCTLATLATGADATLALDLEVTTSEPLAEDALTTFTVTSGGATSTYSVRTGVVDTETELPVQFWASGNVAATQVGAPLMSCDLTVADCASAMAFNGNALNAQYSNNYWDMVALNDAAGARNSATTQLDIPAGATILYASLEWSSVRGADDEWDAALNTARIIVPGATEFADVEADDVTLSSDAEGDREYYQARLDITDLVAAHGAGGWTLGDIALSATRNDPVPTYYGGFAITVVYEHESLPDSRVALFDGSEWIDTSGSADFTFVTDDAADVTVGMVAWEGDRGIGGDSMALNGIALKPLHWNGSSSSTGDSGNSADSTAFGSRFANTLGVDAKPFKSESVAAGTHTLTASTASDQYLVGSLTVTLGYDD